jgi:hypothetical protein
LRKELERRENMVLGDYMPECLTAEEYLEWRGGMIGIRKSSNWTSGWKES